MCQGTRQASSQPDQTRTHYKPSPGENLSIQREPEPMVNRRRFLEISTMTAASLVAPAASYSSTQDPNPSLNSAARASIPPDSMSALREDGGAGLVRYKSPQIGAVARAVSEKLADQASIKDFGAFGDGKADDTSAMQAAINSGRSVFVPRGIYRLTSTIRASSVMIHGEGTESILLFDTINGKNGIEFSPVISEQTSGCRNLAILVKGNNGGSAIKTPKDPTQYSKLRSKFSFSRLLIAGSEKPSEEKRNAFETVSGWAVGIDQGDAWAVEIDEVDGYSTYRSDKAPDAQQKSAFIRLDAAEAMLTARIGGFTCSNWFRGVEIGDRCFFQIERFDIAHAFDGIYQISSKKVFGESKVLTGNINAQHTGIYFSDISTREISGVVVRRHRYGWKQAAYKWQGFVIDKCSGVWLTNCLAQPDESNGPFNGEQVALSLTSSASIHVEGLIVGATCDKGIHASDCVMVMTDNISTWQKNSPADLLYYLSDNTRNSVLGTYSLVSSFQGKTYSDDGSIKGSVQFFQRDIIPTGSAPSYTWRKNNNQPDEKIWKAIQSINTWALITSDDNETNNSNALIFTRSGLNISKCEIRSKETITANLRPNADNNRMLGTPDSRWSQVYSGTPAIVTSDARLKNDIKLIDDMALDAWESVQYCQYKFSESILTKGSDARWHVGLIAQKIIHAFETKGLDAFQYGLLCYDEWEEQLEPVYSTRVIHDVSGVKEEEFDTGQKRVTSEAGNRFGIRYEEALAMEAALMRRTTNRLEARLKQLEAR